MSLLLVVAVVAAAGYAVYRERHTFSTAYQQLGPGLLVASFFCGLAGVGVTWLGWRQVLLGLDVDLPWEAGARVFFVSQLGKYLPGSVWPALMQMEEGRAHGASRRTMLGANVITVALGCAMGLIVACVLLPLYDLEVLRSYWWVLLALPVLLVLLHPRTLPALLDRAFRLLRRPPLGERLDLRREVLASSWMLTSWILLGLEVGVLAGGLARGHGSVSVYLLSIGGMALAATAGLLFIPAPAGAGIRDVVLGLVLSTVMKAGTAVVVVITSRALLTAADLALAGLAATAHRLVAARSAASS
ncbi:MAG TPA: lysylphosphatidylglycerol synthase domain-containing protein [Acidimicrobiales bacterium]|nr:lysylphosphatidylglycerol synthase domain-containing protein [Acidimicrobiales bacterium]